MVNQDPGLVVGMYRAASELLARARFGTGTTFDGKRDFYKAMGYKETLAPSDYRYRYERNAIAGRIVEALPKATWRGVGELIEDEDSNKITTFEQAWLDLDLRLNAWATFLRSDILAGLGRYSIILLGAPGDISTPMPSKIRPEELFFLMSFAEEDANIAPNDWDMDQKSVRFGRPVFYQLKRLDPVAGVAKRAHWSRIIHVADGLLDDHIHGEPRLKRCWNLLDDLDKVTGGGAEAFWLRANQGMQFDIDPEMAINEDGKKEMIDQIDEYVAGMRRFMRTRGMKITPLGSDVANFDPNASAILEQISGGTGIPKRILTGSEMGQLASTQDRLNWAERVADRRFQFAGPQVLRPFVDRLIGLGVLPKPKKYEVRWPDIRDLDPAERAEIASKWADVNQKTKMVVVGPNEIRDHCLGLLPLSVEDLTKIKKEQGIDKLEEAEIESKKKPVPIAAPAGPKAVPKPKAAETNPESDDEDLVDEDDIVGAVRQLSRLGGN